MSTEYDLEILGQKIRYPRSASSAFTVTVSVISICLTVYGSIWFITTRADVGRTTNLYQFITGVFGKEIKTEDGPHASYQYGFWTPSLRTRDYMLEKLEKYGDDERKKKELMAEKWQIVDQDKIDDFGRKIRALYFEGWRRIEVDGYGEKNLKPGYWWICTAKHAIEPARFARYYLDYWGDDDRVYLEILTKDTRYLSTK